jgi:hypothetical protein
MPGCSFVSLSTRVKGIDEALTPIRGSTSEIPVLLIASPSAPGFFLEEWD